MNLVIKYSSTVYVEMDIKKSFIYNLLSGKTRQYLLEKIPLKLSDVNGAGKLLTPELVSNIKHLKITKNMSDDEIMDILKLTHKRTIRNALKK